MQLPPLHTAAEMQQISNAAHIVEGLLISAAAVLALAEPILIRSSPQRKVIFVWPALIFLSGIFLGSYLMIPHHGLEHATKQWAFIWYDPQQRQHLEIAGIIVFGAGLELLARHRSSEAIAAPGTNFLSAGWPLALVAVGILFLTHPQHGTSAAVERATLIHRGLGVLLIAAAISRTTEKFGTFRTHWLGRAWPLFLLATGGLLLIYREPPGAFEPSAGPGVSVTHSTH